jgi:hypothetical protein
MAMMAIADVGGGTADIGTATAAQTAPLTQREADAIALDAYVFFYPLVTMDVTRRVSTNIEAGKKPGFGPQATFHHLREYPSVDFREVVRPNFDTLYSLAWFEVSREPVIFSVPDTGDRYYVAPIYDMWTDAYAAPGKRTTGTKAANFAIVGRGWSGTLPRGVERVESPTSFGWIIIRTQTNGPKDYAAVHKVQDGFRLTPLSQWGKPAQARAPFTPDPKIDMSEPLSQVNRMAASQYFTYAAELMKANPPHATDWSTITRMKRLGIVPGQSFDVAQASPIVRQALEKAPQAALALMKAKFPTMARVTNGWQMNTDSIGVYGNYYLKRAIVTMVGLGANSPDDAVYPVLVADAEGKPINGDSNYVLHFNKDELPPVDAFWSITMYDQAGFQSANPINRYAIGDRDQLTYNADGSLDLYMQHESPGKDKESNWLPSPRGPLGVTMRLYAPRLPVLDGSWNPPAVRRVAAPTR